MKTASETESPAQSQTAASNPDMAPPAASAHKAVSDKVNVIMRGLYSDYNPEPDGKSPEPPKSEEAEKAESKTEPQKAEEKPKEEKAAPVQKKTKRQEPAKAPEIDTDAIADQIAERMKKSAPQAETAPPEAPGELDEEDAKRREILTVLAENKKHAGKLAEFDAFVAKRDKYIKDWNRKNPQSKFDPDDEAHDAWFEENEPEIDPVEYSEAAGTLTARREFDRKWNEKSESDARSRALSEVENSASEQISSRTSELRDATTAKLAELIGETPEEVKGLLEEDGPIRNMHAAAERELSILISETSKLLSPQLGYMADPGNQIHQIIQQSLQEYEAEIASLDEAGVGKLVKNALGGKSGLTGKTFLPIQKYLKLSPHQRGRAWTIYTEPKLVAALLSVSSQTP